MEHSFLPDGPEELTPAWFTLTFRENGLLPVGEVADVQRETIGQDLGMTGVIVRVRLRYTDCEATTPSSVIVKLPLANQNNPSAYRALSEKDEKAAQRYFERCAREVLFYQYLAPLSALAIPQFYYGAAHETTGRVVLVLEDLLSARQGDALSSCSVQDAALMIDQLAQFHAQWWEHPQLETLVWLPRWGGDPSLAQRRYLRCLDPFLQRFGERVPGRVREAMMALATSYGAVREQLQRVPTTLIHADLHLDNVLFTSSPQEPGVVLDWQSVACGRAALDVAQFLFGALETSVRREVEAGLFQRYYEGLRACGVRGYDRDQLMRDCQLALLWLLGATVVWLGSLDLDHLHGRERALAEASITEESFAALLDHEADTLLPL